MPLDTAHRLYFDGGHRKELGGARGFAYFAPDGTFLRGKSIYFGVSARTNNEAEVRAM